MGMDNGAECVIVETEKEEKRENVPGISDYCRRETDLLTPQQRFIQGFACV